MKSLFGEIVFVNNFPVNNVFISRLADYGLDSMYFKLFEKNILFINDEKVTELVKNQNADVDNLTSNVKYFNNISYERLDGIFNTQINEQTIKINLMTPDIMGSPEYINNFLEQVAIYSHEKSLEEIKYNFQTLSKQHERLLQSELDDAISYYQTVKLSLHESYDIASNLGIIEPHDNLNITAHHYIDPLNSINFLLGTKYINQKINDIEKKLNEKNIDVIINDPMIRNAQLQSGLFDFEIKRKADYINYMLANIDTQNNIESSIIIKTKNSTVITQAMPAYPYLLIIFIPFISIFFILFYTYYKKIS